LALFFQIASFQLCFEPCHSALDAESGTPRTLDSAVRRPLRDCFHRNDKTPTLAPYISFRISDPRFHGDELAPAKAGMLRISDHRPANWLCFPGGSTRLNLHNPLLLLILRQLSGKLALFFQIEPRIARINADSSWNLRPKAGKLPYFDVFSRFFAPLKAKKPCAGRFTTIYDCGLNIDYWRFTNRESRSTIHESRLIAPPDVGGSTT